MPLNPLVVSIKVRLWCGVVSGTCPQTPLLGEFWFGPLRTLTGWTHCWITLHYTDIEFLSNWWVAARKEKSGNSYQSTGVSSAERRLLNRIGGLLQLHLMTRE